MKKKHTELEAHFLNIDPQKLHEKLMKVGATDLGEDMYKDIMLYDKELTWMKTYKFFRIRSSSKETKLGFKNFQYKENPPVPSSKPEVKEIEIIVDSPEKALLILEEAGFVAYRFQEKKRHSYKLGNVMIDVDTWPSTPPYAEIEGNSEKEIRAVAEMLGFNWKDAVFRGAGYIIEQYLPVKVRELRYLTFSRIE